MKKYLIFIECGAETGQPTRDYMHYYICRGKDIREAIDDWWKQVSENCKLIREQRISEGWNLEPYKFEDVNITSFKDGVYYVDYRKLQIVELKDNEGYNEWKELKWV